MPILTSIETIRISWHKNFCSRKVEFQFYFSSLFEISNFNNSIGFVISILSVFQTQFLFVLIPVPRNASNSLKYATLIIEPNPNLYSLLIFVQVWKIRLSKFIHKISILLCNIRPINTVLSGLHINSAWLAKSFNYQWNIVAFIYII